MKNSVYSFRRATTPNHPDLKFMLGLLVFTLANFLPFYDRVLFSDDWRNYPLQAIFYPDVWFSTLSRRPFDFMFPKALLAIFQTHIDGLYAVQIAELFLSACLIYFVIQQLFKNDRWFGAAVAGLFLVYPVDFTRMWLSMLNIRFVWVLTLVFILFLGRYAQDIRKWAWIAAGLALWVFTLGIYEGQIGVGLLFTLVVFITTKMQTGRWKAQLLLPFLIIPFFLLWRTRGVPQSGVSDQYLSWMTFDPVFIIVRFLYAVRLAFISWAEPIVQGLHLSIAPELMVLFLAAGIFLWVKLAAFGLKRFLHAVPDATETTTDRPFIQQGLAVGAGLFGAGYFPVIFLMLPSLKEIDSRSNLFASLGMAVLLAVGLKWLVCRYRLSGRYHTALWIISLMPFLLTGMGVNFSVQRAAAAAWTGQKQVWQDVTQRIPNINPACTVFFIVPERILSDLSTREYRPSLTANWEASAALSVLYAQPNLAANLIFVRPDGSYREFSDFRTERTIDPARTGWKPDENAIILSYRLADAQRLEPVSQSIPGHCVIPTNPETARWRFLLE